MRRTQEASRDNILSAAEKLLAERGPQALKLADVSLAAGIAHATVLHHFGSIAGLQTALMDRMIARLVETILAADAAKSDTPAVKDAVLSALFDAFEAPGAARLAAWLEMTGEWPRLTTVRQAVEQVVARSLARAEIAAEEAEDLVMLSALMAIGVGLFGQSLETLIGKPAGRARALALGLIRARLDRQ